MSDTLYVLLGGAIGLGTIAMIWFTINRQDKIWERMRDRYDNDDGSLRT